MRQVRPCEGVLERVDVEAGWWRRRTFLYLLERSVRLLQLRGRQLLRSGSLERQHAVDNLTRPAPAADVDAVEGPFEFGDADASIHVRPRP